MSITSKKISVKNDNNIIFNIVIVEEGDSYGLNNVLTHNEKQPLVEFYDSRYPHTENGQFVSRYNISTIIDRDERYGLNLEGSEPNWNIDAKTMALVTNFLVNNEAYINYVKNYDNNNNSSNKFKIT